MFMKRLALLAAAGLLAATSAAASAPASASGHPESGSELRLSAFPATAAAASKPPIRTYFSDPRTSSPIAPVIVNRIDGAPSGAILRMAHWNITDETTAKALLRAFNRHVHVRVITAKGNCPTTRPTTDWTRKLADALGSDMSADSWLRCVKGSGRGSGGTMHMKTLTLTTTGGVNFVTLVGSLNATGEAYNDQWGDLVEFPDRRRVHNAYAWAFDNTARDITMASPYKTFDLRNNGLVRFYPLNNPTDPAADPVAKRLKNVPASSETKIWVANYSIHSWRGKNLVKILKSKARAGAKVTILYGPPSKSFIDAQRSSLKAAGIKVVNAADPSCYNADGEKIHLEPGNSCNYLHLKAMTISSVVAGTRKYETFMGSDNWEPLALRSDEVLHRINGKRTYDEYLTFFKAIKTTYN